MNSHRAAYTGVVASFIAEPAESILGQLASGQQGDLTPAQRYAWAEQIRMLKQSLTAFPKAVLCFEYTIPRMGKRVDNILILDHAVAVLEFKVGAESYDRASVLQAEDYALDLKNFHAGSRHVALVPILVATNAANKDTHIELAVDGVAGVLLTNESMLDLALMATAGLRSGPAVSAEDWLTSGYRPTPTIIEASQALYSGHDVAEIASSEADSDNLGLTTQTLNSIIDTARRTNQKAICLLTGVPGAGKTLAGLNLASERRRVDADGSEHAVFLSGNGPLVKVLQEALARDEVVRAKLRGESVKVIDARRNAKAFIQNIHHFRDECIEHKNAPTERVVVFDEAQRAWNHDQTQKFMKQKKGIPDFKFSEPAFLISAMDRHDGWAVIVCLIGGGQEINTGEAGMEEWVRALTEHFPDWQIHLPGQTDSESYLASLNNKELEERLTRHDGLHLGVSIRSFRSEQLSNAIGSLLSGDASIAKTSLAKIENYPIRITRSLNEAKMWIREQARETERYGLLASSGAKRLKPLGIVAGGVKGNEVNWFLDNDEDVRSSYYLEDAASEFEVQGLELDWGIVVWDGDLIHDGELGWIYRAFKGTKWQKINKESDQQYRLNAYRVLLTRARQGIVVVVPEGNEYDCTRNERLYAPTWHYLDACGLKII